MRRTCSAPHSMDALGVPDVLAPSGGPMRRVASSVGMRRSNSFFWTPAAHHEFEAACEELARSGIVPTAPAILHAMGARPDLKIADIDKHLKVSTRTPRRAGSPRVPRRCTSGHLFCLFFCYHLGKLCIIWKNLNFCGRRTRRANLCKRPTIPGT